MAIHPPSDIVLDVARAADPARLQAATAKLARMAGASSAADFAEVLETAEGTSASIAAPPTTGLSDLRGRMPLGDLRSQSSSASPGQAVKAYQGLEAVLLQGLVEDMLPKDEGGFFGTGGAGAVWRGVFAEELAMQLAKSGKLGIARILAGRSPQIERGAAALSSSGSLPAPTTLATIGATEHTAAASAGAVSAPFDSAAQTEPARNLK